VTTPPPPVARTLDEANEIIARQHAEQVELRAENAALKGRVQELEARLAELEARLSQNSSNSSRPPSSDPPWSKPKRKPPEGPSGRKPGGQPGHAGHAREAVPAERVDAVVDVYPERCAVCGAALPGDLPGEDAHAHQVTDLPESQARVTEYRLWRKRCPHCGGRTRAKRPADVPEDAFGPRLKAAVALLTAKYHVSRLGLVAMLHDLFSVEMSAGAVQATCERVSAAVAPATEAIHREVALAPVAHADESGWREHAKRAWLWTATTPDAAYYLLAKSRGRDALAELLPPDWPGFLHVDRWRPYEVYDVRRRQVCHAHLRRDFQGAIDRGGEAKRHGEWLLAESDRLFHVWHAFDRGEVARAGMVEAMRPVRMRWRRALGRASESTDRKTRALARDLIRLWPALWTFVHVDGVEPTNNDAERAIRPAVLWRKGSFGTWSGAGSLFVSRMLTVIETARRRGAGVVDWLELACRASMAGTAPPPLLSG
jgi:transposase